MSINDGGDGVLSAAEIAAGVTADITLPADAAAGDTLDVDTDGDGIPDVTVVLSAADITAGVVTITVPPADIPADGVLTVAAEITDPAGNTSPSANDTSATDSTPPNIAEDNATGIPGNPVVVDVLANDDTVDPTTVKIVDPTTGDPVTELIVPGEGTWSVDPVTGAITFTPEVGFTGDPTPISYTAVDMSGNLSNAVNVGVDYIQVPADDNATGTPGTPVTVDVLANDDTVDSTTVKIVDPATGDPVTELVVPGEGTWIVDPTTGTITFTPEAGFTGDPTPIDYTAEDNNGNAINPTKVTVDYPQSLEDDERSGVAGNPISLNAISNDNDINASSMDFDAASVGGVGKDTDGDGDIDEVTVDGEGVWSVDENGVVTFTPEDGFVDSPTPIKYSAKDNLGNKIAPATITLSYTASIGSDDDTVTITHYGATTIDVLGNDNYDGEVTIEIIEQPEHGTAVVVIGEDGKPYVQYTPDPDYNNAPDSFRYTITDANGQTASATVALDIQCGSSQTSDGGDAMSTVSMLIMMFFTLMLGLYFVRKEDERGEA